ncbi:MAG: mechanosensitive ion channel domain-containing protein [Pseudomonadota bacterium]
MEEIDGIETDTATGARADGGTDARAEGGTETEATIVEQEVGEVTDFVTGLALQMTEWLQANILTWDALYQVPALVVALLLALCVRRPFRRLMDGLSGERTLGTLAQRLIRTVSAISVPVCWAIGLWVAAAILGRLELPFSLLRLVGSLLNAYIVIRMATIFIPSAYWSAVFAWIAWSVAALNSIGLLDPAIAMMQATGFDIGEVRITLWTVIKGAMVTALLIWLASILAEMVQRRLEHVQTLNSALRLLISKLIRIALVIVAVVVGLTAVGVDLTAFAVFSGAIGIGVGLGLQRTIANLVASFSLLADRSLKPGDVIEVDTSQGPTYGVVGKMTTRYVSVRTRDGTETLIPNEVLISNPVTNWSYSDKRVRRKIPIGVSYDADLDRVIPLCLQAADECDRVLKNPKPACLVKGFGDNSIDLELRIWIDDPEEGVSNIASLVMLQVWRIFRQHDIEIPYPQRDLHLRSAVPLVVETPPDASQS